MAKILIVDGIRQLSKRQKGILTSSRVNVMLTDYGQEALVVARKELPQLIVIDNHVSNADGVASCRQIKTDPHLKHIPVVMLAHADDAADLGLYLAAGADDCLPKPVDSDLFMSTLKKHLPSIECRGVRIPLRTEVRLIVADGFHVGMTKDISPHGIFVTSELQPATGDELLFSFVLPGGEAPIDVRGRVAWLKENGADGKSPYIAGFGVKFLEFTGNIPMHRKKELEAYVHQQAAKVAKEPVWS